MTVKAFRERTEETYYVTRGGRFAQPVAKLAIFYFRKTFASASVKTLGPNAVSDERFGPGEYNAVFREALAFVDMYTDPNP